MEGFTASQINQERINIKDPEEARAFVDEMIKNGERPLVTVPEKYLGAMAQGLKPHSTWIQGLDLIVGTLGRPPYLPQIPVGEKRKVVYIKNINPQNIQPRFTGPDNAFHGVVVLNGPIEPIELEVKNVD